jgi:hypothetical protein
LQSYSVISLVLSLAIGFICSTNSSLEHLYAQEDSTSEDLQQPCPPETGPDPDGGCSPLPDEAIGDESILGGSDFTTQVPDEPVVTPPVPDEPVVTPPVPDEPVVTPPVPDEPIVTPPVPGEPVGPFEDFSIPNIEVPDVKRIIEEPAKKITGSFENTLSTINPNIPVSTLMIVGVVAVVAIGAGVASFSRHRHGRRSSSHSAQDQTQQDDTEEEQIYEDVQIVTQGGIEEV